MLALVLALLFLSRTSSNVFIKAQRQQIHAEAPGLEFPQTVYKLTVDVTQPDCVKACRLLLHRGNTELVHESVPRANVVFTGLPSGSYTLSVNCSSHPVSVCNAEPKAVKFQAEHDHPDAVIAVGRLSLIRRNPVDPPRQEKTGWFTFSTRELLGLVAVVIVHWLGLRFISNFTASE